MVIVLDPKESAVVRGIKTAGIGKKGSKPLSAELVSEIMDDIKSGQVTAVAKGALLAGLYAKGIEPQEKPLVDALPLKELLSDAPEFIQWVCGQLLQGITLDRHTAYDMGTFLFSGDPGDAARGWIAGFLRVRYETDEEYEGLWQAMQDTLGPAFTSVVPQGEPIIQMAEPFDGVDHSYMITPLIGRHLQAQGYRVVHQVGRNSGPKSEMNLWEVAESLGQKAAAGNADLAQAKPSFGWFFHQSLMSKALDHWVGLRRQIVKRPFLATLERFMNPLKADILIASAFHAPYGEKMLALAEAAGFKGAVIVRNGMEGTIAFPLLRPVKLLLSAKRKDGTFRRDELTVENPAEVEIEDMVERPKASDNARLIETYVKEGSSGHPHFDLRVRMTYEGLQEALKWFRFKHG